ncbi:MAG: chromate transporter [Clostridia bacterium]|nr:chromate transporter [Clostridia bacterium]
MKKLFLLLFTMMKIGLFTFGGGYAMISLLENEFVSKRKWLDAEEFLDMVAIAESTPGPIAINGATYIGYRVARLPGAIFGTVGVVTPSFVIIYLISLFFHRFLSVAWVASAFRGIQVAVVFLIFAAALRLFKKLSKTPFTLTVFIAVTLAAVALSLFAIRFSSVWFVLIGAALGLFAYLFALLHRDKGDGEQKQAEDGGEGGAP